MIAVLIHPKDLNKMIATSKISTSTITLNDAGSAPIDDLIEIFGVLYYQTTRVPPISREI